MKKEDLRPGDVVLFPPHKGDFIAWAISFLTDGEVNHAALCYPDARGQLCVAESILKDGLVLNPFAEKISKEYPLRVARMKHQNDMIPVLKAAGKYLAEGNNYPNFNLGLLGALLLTKKFVPHTLKNKIIYQFMTLVAGKLMKLVQDKKHPGQHPMSCSQFVAQCFTDAGENYDLKFKNLSIRFEQMTSPLMTKAAVASCNEEQSISPLSLLEESIPASNVLMTRSASAHQISGAVISDLSPAMEMQLTEEFIRVLSEKPQVKLLATRSNNSINDEISLAEMRKPVKDILFSLNYLIAGKQTEQLQEALDNLKMATARNYFVSPQDIWTNCPESLEKVGLLSY